MSGNISLNDFIKPSDLGLPDSEGNRPSEPPAEITQLTEGIELIKRWEGLELNAYPDPSCPLVRTDGLSSLSSRGINCRLNLLNPSVLLGLSL